MSRRCDKCQWDECVVCVCDEETALLFLPDTFLLRVFLRSAAMMLADGECWRGGLLHRAHAVAPSRLSSKRPQVGSLGHTSFVPAERPTIHTRRWIPAQVCSDIINLGSGVTFLGQMSFCGASGEAVRCPCRAVFNSLLQIKKQSVKKRWLELLWVSSCLGHVVLFKLVTNSQLL